MSSSCTESKIHYNGKLGIYKEMDFFHLFILWPLLKYIGCLCFSTTAIVLFNIKSDTLFNVIQINVKEENFKKKKSITASQCRWLVVNLFIFFFFIWIYRSVLDTIKSYIIINFLCSIYRFFFYSMLLWRYIRSKS